jgi:hypothetical protein
MGPLERAKAQRLHSQQQAAAEAAREQQGAGGEAEGAVAGVGDVQRYLSAPTLIESPDTPFRLLDWWRTTGKSEYPYLARVAAKFLCAQGTSARSESNFSSLKQTYCALRNRLSERRVKQNMLLYLNRRLVRGIADIVAVDDGKKEQNLAKRAVRDIEKALTARLAAATDASAASGAAAAAGGGAETSERSFDSAWEHLANEGLSWAGAAAAGSNDVIDLDSSFDVA